VIDHRPGDLVCTVEASVGLAELHRALAREGQMLALDPPQADRLSVGDVFDRALSGPLSHRYGEPRDLVLGLTVELPDGTVARSGGRVVKNVAGYDLGKLFTGADGRLGRIRELTVRLHPLPAATCTVVAELADPRALEPFAPACVELAWPGDGMLVRFASAAAADLAERASGLVGGRIVDDDEELWTEHRERAAGLAAVDCLPVTTAATLDRLRADGATQVVGRWARGRLFADVAVAQPALSALESRVVGAFGG
jgi:glycolate oxidase FAD binding subunit